jgi:hypothetical protein
VRSPRTLAISRTVFARLSHHSKSNLRSYLKPVLHPAVCGFYVLSMGKNWPNRKAHVRCFYPADHTQKPAEEFGVPIIFCVHHAILDLQSACKGLVRRKSVTLAISAHAASLKWGVRGKSGIQTITVHVLVSHFPLVFPVSSTYNERDSCLSSACAAWLARARTHSTPHGTRLLKVSCNFGCSVRVQLGKLI